MLSDNISFSYFQNFRTMLNGGSQANVVPPSLSATFDIRFANDVDLDEFDKKVSKTQLHLSAR